MKVLVNGGLNLSELDGWWAEAYSPEVGWAIGDGKEHGEDAAWDATEAQALYDILENQVVPQFYDRNQKGIPEQWTARMRKSMATLTPQFSSNRTIRQYTDQYYLPAAAHYRKRAAQHGVEGDNIVKFKHELLEKWDQVQFEEVQTREVEIQKAFRVQVRLNGIDPGNVRVELYADGINGTPPERIRMEPVAAPAEAGMGAYEAEVNGSRPAGDYTARLIPFYEGVAVPLEDNLICWQR
jgi:starch phosphorylase